MKATRLPFLVSAASLISQSQLFAQATWVGSGTAGTPALWSDNANWTGTAPTNSATSALTFLNSAANSFSSNDLTGLIVSSITVPANDGAPVPANTLDNTIGGNAITLTGGITVGTGNWQTINIDMALGAAVRTVAVNTGRLYLGGVLSGTGAALTKSGGGELYLTNANTFTGNGTNTVNSTIPGAGTFNQVLLFSGSGSGSVVVQNTASLGGATNSIRFSGGGSGNLHLQTDTSVNGLSVFSGSGNGGTISAGRSTAGVGITHTLGTLDLSSVTLTVNTGANVTSGTARVGFTSLSMSGGNDNNPLTLAGSAAISIGTAGITNNTNVTRRLQLDGSNANNTIGVIGDLAPGASVGSAKVNLIKANTSTWTLTANNTFTGTTTISGGTLQLGNGSTTGSLSTSSAITNNSTLAINRSDTVTQGTDFASTISGTGSLRKSGAGNLILSGANLATGSARDVLTFTGTGSGTVTLKDTAALGLAGNTVRFGAAIFSGFAGVLDLQTDTSVSAYNIASGTGNGGIIIANRATSGTTINHSLGALDLSSITLTVNKGGNVTGSAAVSFTELKMNGGNDFNPVTLGGDAEITINGPVSITANGIAKRLQLDGTSANNVVTGVISDTANATVGAKVSLIKDNSSTWYLQGNNTYTGETKISGGTLKLDFPCLDDAATVTIDGVLQMTHSQTDTVNKLFIGGIEQAPGLYKAVGALGSGTPIPQLTGTGKLNVLTGIITDAFASWALTNITAINPSADATPGGDPDLDGVTNLSEFAFNGNPLSGSDNGTVKFYTADSSADVETANKELILTIAMRETNPAAPAFSGSPLSLTVAGVTYTIQGCLDLTNFNAAVTEVTPITTGLPDLGGNPDYEYRSFSLDASNGLLGKGFLRAKVAN